MADAHLDRIVDELDRHFGCKICNGILIGATSTDCGHIFCSYCLDLFRPLSQSCPECSSHIKSFIPLAQIDKQIESLFKSLPAPIQYSFQARKVSRNEKNSNRKTTKQDEESLFSDRNFEELCSSQHKSFLPKLSPQKSSATPRPKPRSKITLRNTSMGVSYSEAEEISNNVLDSHKIEELFKMYDDFLQQDPQAGGEAFPTSSSSDEEESPELKELKERKKSEIELLLKEAEGVVELNQFVSKWSHEIKEEMESESEEEGSNGLLMKIKDLKLRMKNAGVESVPKRRQKLKPIEFPEDENNLQRFSRKLSAEELSLDVTLCNKNNYDMELDTLESSLLLFESKKGPCQSARMIPIIPSQKSSSRMFPGNCKSARGSYPSSSRNFMENDFTKTSSKFVKDTVSFCKKINECKGALKELRANSSATSTANGIRKLIPIKECKTGRLPEEFRTSSFSSILQTPRNNNLPRSSRQVFPGPSTRLEPPPQFQGPRSKAPPANPFLIKTTRPRSRTGP